MHIPDSFNLAILFLIEFFKICTVWNFIFHWDIWLQDFIGFAPNIFSNCNYYFSFNVCLRNDACGHSCGHKTLHVAGSCSAQFLHILHGRLGAWLHSLSTLVLSKNYKMYIFLDLRPESLSRSFRIAIRHVKAIKCSFTLIYALGKWGAILLTSPTC